MSRMISRHCLRKRRYDSKAQADAAVIGYRQDGIAKRRLKRCHTCDGFHLTDAVLTRRRP
jgi:hypothetical protein